MKHPSGAVTYFIQAGDDGHIKVGWTTGYVRDRMASLQTGCPQPLKLRCFIPGGRRTEAAMHLRFGYLRVTGEWFKPGEDLLQFIADVKSGVDKARALRVAAPPLPPEPPATPLEKARCKVNVSKMVVILSAPVPGLGQSDAAFYARAVRHEDALAALAKAEADLAALEIAESSGDSAPAPPPAFVPPAPPTYTFTPPTQMSDLERATRDRCEEMKGRARELAGGANAEPRLDFAPPWENFNLREMERVAKARRGMP